MEKRVPLTVDTNSFETCCVRTLAPLLVILGAIGFFFHLHNNRYELSLVDRLEWKLAFRKNHGG